MARPSGVESGQHTSRTDVPLTANGERQASALRGMLAAVHPVLVLCSPRQRAVRTAELAGLAVDAIDDDLVEWDYGDYEGMTTQEIRKAVPGWSLWTHPMPGGETPSQVGGPGGPGARARGGPSRRGAGRARRARPRQPGYRRAVDWPAGNRRCADCRWIPPRRRFWEPSTIFPSSTDGTCRIQRWPERCE